MADKEQKTMDAPSLVWWAGNHLEVTDGDKGLTILMGDTPAAEVARMLHFAADVLAHDPVHADAVRAKCDGLNEWVEATLPRPQGRDAIRVLPDAS